MMSHRNRSGNRDVLVAFGLAVGLALLAGAALFVFGRPTEVAGARATPGAAPNVPAAEDAARRTPRDSAIPDRQPPVAVADLTGGDDSSSSRPDQPPAIDSAAAARPADQEADQKSPRRLVRRMRREVQAGSTKEALATAGEIAALLPGSERRSKILGVLAQAESGEGIGPGGATGQTVDFDSLIQLIESTISPNSWDSVGGAGTVEPFPGGVYIDTRGLMKLRDRPGEAAGAAAVRTESRDDAAPAGAAGATLRKISLPRLEREVARYLARGELIPDEIRNLAGLQQVQYVLVYPEEHDVVIAGPADEPQRDEFGRVVGRNNGRPVLQLDDLVVILRACFADSDTFGVFGCGIYPRRERLEQVQQFLTASAAAGPIEPRDRPRWLADLRDQLGEQDIQVFGVPAGSRVAHVMIEADYRMKLVGIGLEQAAVPGIPSYFDLLGEPDDARLARGIDTLRWWFTLNYDAITATPERDAFELAGSRVQVLSENELLTARGDRVHTGQSDPINAEFARNFSVRYAALAERDANYADLAAVFDLAVLGGLLRGQAIPQAIGWEMNTFLDPLEYIVLLRPAPRTVETVMNHRVYRGRHIMAAVSGGVHVNPWKVVAADKIRDDAAQTAARQRTSARTGMAARWWWN
jgi:hypothetical protein